MGITTLPGIGVGVKVGVGGTGVAVGGIGVSVGRGVAVGSGVGWAQAVTNKPTTIVSRKIFFFIVTPILMYL
jgi:hypothetical protein